MLRRIWLEAVIRGCDTNGVQQDCESKKVVVAIAVRTLVITGHCHTHGGKARQHGSLVKDPENLNA